MLGRITTAGSSLSLNPWINCVYVLGWYSTFRSSALTLTAGAVKYLPMLNILYNTRGIVLTDFFDKKNIASFFCYDHKFHISCKCHTTLSDFHEHIIHHCYNLYTARSKTHVDKYKRSFKDRSCYVFIWI